MFLHESRDLFQHRITMVSRIVDLMFPQLPLVHVKDLFKREYLACPHHEGHGLRDAVVPVIALSLVPQESSFIDPLINRLNRHPEDSSQFSCRESSYWLCLVDGFCHETNQFPEVPSKHNLLPGISDDDVIV